MAELEEFKAQAEVEEANKALFMRYVEAWDNGDFEALKDIHSPDFVLYLPPGKDGSLEDILENCKQQLVMYPDRVFIDEDLIAKGDKVISRWTFRGTHTGDVEGFPATGNKFEITGIEIIRVENGKIVESWEESNQLSFYRQLGFELKPKEEK